MPVDGGTTAGKSDRPALKADVLAEQMTGIPNSKAEIGTSEGETNAASVKAANGNVSVE